MKKLLIIQTGLSKNSSTHIICLKALEISKKFKDLESEILDLRDYNLEFCDGRKIEDYNEDMNKIKNIVEKSDFYIIAYPVYNYSFSGVCKNFIDIFSYYMDSKKVGIIHNSWSTRSFSDGFSEIFKILSLHNNISTILPLVHCHNEDFGEDGNIINGKVVEKIENLIVNLNKN